MFEGVAWRSRPERWLILLVRYAFVGSAVSRAANAQMAVISLACVMTTKRFLTTVSGALLGYQSSAVHILYGGGRVRLSTIRDRSKVVRWSGTVWGLRSKESGL